MLSSRVAFDISPMRTRTGLPLAWYLYGFWFETATGRILDFDESLQIWTNGCGQFWTDHEQRHGVTRVHPTDVSWTD